MKCKIILLSIILLVVCQSKANAQASATIGVSVTILPRIEIIEERSLSFGEITPGQTIHIDNHSDQAGCFILCSDKWGESVVDFQLPEYLSDGNGNHIKVEIDKADVVSQSGARRTISTRSRQQLPVEREQRIYMGGSITVPEDVDYFGTYYGEITLVVEY